MNNNIMLEIGHLELTFESERPPPPRVAQQELLMAAEKSEEYSEDSVAVFRRFWDGV